MNRRGFFACFAAMAAAPFLPKAKRVFPGKFPVPNADCGCPIHRIKTKVDYFETDFGTVKVNPFHYQAAELKANPMHRVKCPASRPLPRTLQRQLDAMWNNGKSATHVWGQ